MRKEQDMELNQAGIANFIRMAEKEGINIALALDELGNVLLGGDPQETISSRCGKLAETGSVFGLEAQRLVNFIMRNPQHCHHAILPNVGQNGLIPD